jgi:hypothetical protein
MIRNICYELLRKTELTTDILIKFEDKKVTKEYYTFIKERFDNYGSNISSKFTLTLNLEYDEIKQILFIGLIISIPDIRNPKNVLLEQIINEQSYRFIDFYERNFKLFKNKSEDE